MLKKCTLLAFCWVFGGLATAQDRVPLIINGQPTDEYPAVGIVGEASVGGFCTGTLISPYHVLTAAHCGEAILDFGTEDSGTFEVGGRIYLTRSVEIISTYDNQRFTDDLAILVLDEPVDGVEPMGISSVPPEVDEPVTLVGFGGQGTPQAGSDGSFGQKQIGFAIIDDVSAFEFSWTYDDPTLSNPGPGDSGGPVLIERDGMVLIAGTVSSGTTADAGLGDTTFNMRLDAYFDWIGETVLATMPAENAPTEGEDNQEMESEEPQEEPSDEIDETADAPIENDEVTPTPPTESDSDCGPATNSPVCTESSVESDEADAPSDSSEGGPEQVEDSSPSCKRPGYRPHKVHPGKGRGQGNRAGGRRGPSGRRPSGSYRDATRFQTVVQAKRRAVKNVRRPS